MAVLRYAQEYGGQKLHLVEAHTDGTVSYRSLCGRKPQNRGTWRMTVNCSFGNACKKCLKVADRLREPLPTVDLHIDVKAGV